MALRALVTALTAALIMGNLALAAHAGGAEDAALAAINAQRQQAGCAALQPNPALQAAAQAHASAMATQDFFDHRGRDGSTMRKRIEAAGYRWRQLAENIAAGQTSAGEVVDVWMKSPGHRKNILNCSLAETGLAMVYQADDQPVSGHSYPFFYYWVQTFGSP
jgi:uncharacterized protein YkwD